MLGVLGFLKKKLQKSVKIQLVQRWLQLIQMWL